MCVVIISGCSFWTSEDVGGGEKHSSKPCYVKYIKKTASSTDAEFNTSFRERSFELRLLDDSVQYVSKCLWFSTCTSDCFDSFK